MARYLEQRCDDSLFESTNISFPELDCIIVIPSYKETFQDLQKTIISITSNKNAPCYYIYILVNYKSTDDYHIKEESAQLSKQLKEYVKALSLPIIVFQKELTGKNAGVGLARKLLMDTALLTFNSQSKNGLIINLDADTTVQDNYLKEISEHFLREDKMEAASIAFHHPDAIDSNPILYYELHLRYFINMQRWVELPYAYQTIGSAMAVRSYAYAKEGGMNVRKAGEDFYFMHKFSKNHSLQDICKTYVYPSGRVSDRVPFGTGRAITKIAEGGLSTYNTYNPASFIVIKNWVSTVEHSLATSTQKPIKSEDTIWENFLAAQSWMATYTRLVNSSGDPATRIKNYYNWFDAFLLMKGLHFLRDNAYPNVSIEVAVAEVLGMLSKASEPDMYKALIILKEHDLRQSYTAQWRAGFSSKLSKASASLSTHQRKRS